MWTVQTKMIFLTFFIGLSYADIDGHYTNRFLNETCGEINLDQSDICIQACEEVALVCVVECGYDQQDGP